MAASAKPGGPTIADALKAIPAYNPGTVHLAKRAMPTTNPAEWVKSEDYPKWALVHNVVGRVGFTLDVDDTGHVSACHITHTSGVPDLDKVACDKVMERATFKPATDDKGKPVRSTWASSVNWALPDQGPDGARRHLEAAELVVAVVVEPDGSVSDCMVEKAAAAAAAAGDQFCAGAHDFPPILDDAGKPQRRRVRFSTSVAIEPVAH